MRTERWLERSSRVAGAVFGVLAAGVAFLAVSAVPGCGEPKEAAAPPPVVEVVEVAVRDVPIYKEWVGTMDGNINAVINPQVTGYLIQQNYVEGQLVKKGQVLFEIDPRTFQAAYDQARGSLDQARGDLARQEAAYVTAKADLARVKPLAEKNAVSQKDLDDATGRDLATRASVDAAQAAVVAAAANLESTRLNLGFTKITSPVDGIAGIAQTQIGNLVGPMSQQELTTVSNVDPIKVYINVSEREYLETRGSSEDVDKIPLELILADGSTYPHKGVLALSARQIDPSTGTLKIGALFPNPGNILRPGGYGLVRVQMEVRKGALVVPQRAVGDVQGKHLVAVVGSDNKVEVRPVKVGPTTGSDWVIDEGLKPGDSVVAEGIQKVRTGVTVTPKPFVPGAPAAQGATAPETKPTQAPAGKR